MSINPVSDIVLDVARAADPMRSQAAADKLSSGVAASSPSTSGFDNALTDATTAPQASQNSFVGGSTSPPKILSHLDARAKAYKGLEQLVLKNLVENMLPKESAAFFGTGTASDIWRSFLADQLATQVGKTVDLGVVAEPAAAPRRGPVHNRVQAITYGGPSLYGSS